MPGDQSGTGILPVGIERWTGCISDRLEAWPTTSHHADSSQSPFVFLFEVMSTEEYCITSRDNDCRLLNAEKCDELATDR